MTAHRYAVGDRVLYTQHRFPHVTWKSPYVIAGCLASDSMEPQYEIRSVQRLEGRVAGEHELTRNSLPAQAFGSSSLSRAGDDFSANDAANLNIAPLADAAQKARRFPQRMANHR